jgi:hypothetical protein
MKIDCAAEEIGGNGEKAKSGVAISNQRSAISPIIARCTITDKGRQSLAIGFCPADC